MEVNDSVSVYIKTESNLNNVSSDTLSPQLLKDFCVWTLLGCIFNGDSTDNLCYFKKAIGYLQEGQISEQWLMKLFIVAICGINEFGIDCWTALLSIVGRNLHVTDLGHEDGEIDSEEALKVLHPECTYYFLGWVGKNITKLPNVKPLPFELGTSYVGPRENIKRLEPYLSPEIMQSVEFDQKMGLSGFLPFSEIQGRDIVQCTIESSSSFMFSEQRYTVLEMVVFDTDQFNKEEITLTYPFLQARGVKVAVSKEDNEHRPYKKLKPEQKHVFKHRNDDFEDFYLYISNKWTRRTRDGVQIDPVIAVVKDKNAYESINESMALTIPELMMILS